MTGILCEIDVQEETELDSDRSAALLRIFQEALKNLVRHAGATKIMVKLKDGKNKVTLEILSDGEVLAEEQLSRLDSFELSVLGMSDRVYAWRGKIIISGNPDGGAKIEVILPAGVRQVNHDHLKNVTCYTF